MEFIHLRTFYSLTFVTIAAFLLFCLYVTFKYVNNVMNSVPPNTSPYKNVNNPSRCLNPKKKKKGSAHTSM